MTDSDSFSDPEDSKITELLMNLYNEDQQVRIYTIHQLGESGDELCLKELRKQLKYISIEHQSLIIEVDKLKKKLGVK